MIELTYIEQQGGNTIKRYFKTWKSLDRFVMKEKIDKYKVEPNERSTTDRISISFNTFVRGTLGNRKELNKLIL